MSEGLHQAYRLAETVVEGEAGLTLILDGALPAAPGQFVMVWLPGVEERPLAVVDTSPLTLTVCRVGPFTCAMCALRPGDRLWVRGPFGKGFPLHGRRHLLVGGGSGVASLPLLARQARAHGHQVDVVLGARSADGLMLGWMFEALGCPPYLATDDGSAGLRGTTLDAAAPLLEGKAPDAIYGCGPEPMLQVLTSLAEQRRIPCWVSRERTMRCGIGVCGACHCGDRLVCVDGPVFRVV
jgi:dihydroorotate dehydrogenase electron transfer subunit